MRSLPYQYRALYEVNDEEYLTITDFDKKKINK